MTQERPERPPVDPDIADNPEGAPVMTDQLWGVLKRYILRGSTQYQEAGLRVLSSLTHHFPLDEATSVLEEYFSQHDYLPTDDMRGGVLLSPLKAAYAVATAYDYHSNTGVAGRMERTRRILSLLQAHLRRARSLGEGLPPGDAAVVEETIVAIRSERKDFEPTYRDAASRVEQADTELSDGPPASEATEPAAPAASQDREELQDNVRGWVERYVKELTPATPSPIDVITGKYEIERVKDSIASLERVFGTKLDNMDKQIDRHLAHGQLSWGRWAVVVAIVLGVAAIVVSLLK